ncbi:DNA repair protein RecN [Inconstantimicrobium porci]|uniref:DNA repair protein RecN n=1 Tax=Inconstantimicrobium porci TaxID=2652291 RepID=A0A7X2MVX9_9CLOT|nr:DNA repair protein RecN [Inconstantimicrobium porci]MDD6771874.1 DNA repair protein RecN [Inconstantimicrobium porci]MSR90052.1 DNA repair protein RecN [Inconstantimicrobium porci]
MILQLSIKNFALIENEEVDFSNGFNVLYGETGAGKSILIDAIDFVVGGRFGKDIIRTGENKAYVEAVFALNREKNEEIAEKLDIEYNDTLCISREIFQNGKSIIKINGRASTVSAVRNLSKELIDIHGQHQNMLLFDKDNYIPMVDSYDYGKIRNILTRYHEEYNNLKKIREDIERISGTESNDKVQAFLEFQINEIDKAKLKKNEEDHLNEEFKLLSNAQKINTAVCTSYSLLGDSNNSSSVIDNLYTISREISGVQEYSKKLSKINDDIMNAYYSLQESSRELREMCDEIVFDQNELDIINDRLYQIADLKKKYGSSIEEILEYKDKITKQFEEMKNSEAMIEELKNKEKVLCDELIKIGREIHDLRVANSSRLEKAIHDNLKYIGLEKCKFKIDMISTDTIKSNGTDECEFFVSTNPGEPFKPITKVASGGELSRIMLAIKSVFVDKDNVPTVIFDEIDTGISGRIAHCVGEKMYEIAVKHQVFCITHLPQIACFSDNHYLVKKTFKNEKTYSNISRLNESQKINEVAKMLGGTKMLHSSLENAKSMIEYANDRKKEICCKYTKGIDK